MMYVCHGDDSGKGGPYFVIGGLTATVNQWLAFSREWQAALDEPPKLEYFKFTEAFNLQGQFHRRRFKATERNARGRKFLKAINRHCALAQAVITDAAAHKALYGGKFSATVDQPFVATYTYQMQLTAIRLNDAGARAKVDFIFDEMDDTQLLEVRRAHWVMKTFYPELAERLGEPPITRDDKDLVALQAADLIAGAVRQQYEDEKKRTRTLARKWIGELKIPVFVDTLQHSVLVDIGNNAAEMRDSLNLKYEDGKARSKRFKEERKKLRAKKTSSRGPS